MHWYVSELYSGETISKCNFSTKTDFYLSFLSIFCTQSQPPSHQATKPFVISVSVLCLPFTLNKLRTLLEYYQLGHSRNLSFKNYNIFKAYKNFHLKKIYMQFMYPLKTLDVHATYLRYVYILRHLSRQL